MIDKITLPVSIFEVDPSDLDAHRVMLALSATLADVTGDSGQSSFDPDDVRGEGACFIIARDVAGDAVGCGAYRRLDKDIAEMKRMFASPSTKGVGAAMLFYLEASARNKGYTQCWLETRRVNARAVKFYLRHGYQEIENFGKYVGRPEAICFGKIL